jgi:hypothetical protein
MKKYLVTLMMEAISSSETSVLARATWHNIPEDAIFMVTAVKTSTLSQTTQCYIPKDNTPEYSSCTESKDYNSLLCGASMSYTPVPHCMYGPFP